MVLLIYLHHIFSWNFQNYYGYDRIYMYYLYNFLNHIFQNDLIFYHIYNINIRFFNKTFNFSRYLLIKLIKVNKILCN